MRLLLVLITLSGLPAFAGEDGVWTGYVRGWVPNNPPHRSVTPWRAAPRGLPEQQVPPPLLWQQYAAQQALWMHLAYGQQQRLELQQSEAARRQVEAQERLAAQQLAAREQQLAAERQLLTQQLLLQQERLLREQEEMTARVEAERQRESAHKLAAEQAATREREEKEREARALSAKPQVKGPEVHRWVDTDGVVHLSTKRPGEKR